MMWKGLARKQAKQGTKTLQRGDPKCRITSSETCSRRGMGFSCFVDYDVP
jgi:hypothetical protein